MKIDWKALNVAIAVARKAAEVEKQRDSSDKGSCNLDFVYLDAAGIREASARNRGFSVFKAGWHGRIMRLYSGDGQAGLNERMVQVFAKSMKDQGFSVGVYYQLD